MARQRLNLAQYTQALVDYATQTDDVEPLEDLRDSLFTQIAAGKGKEMITAAPGGKSFMYEITMTIQEQFTCVVAAIKAFNEEAGDSPITFLDFSEM